MRGQRGFSLTELLVACAILGIVLAGLVTLQQQGQAAYLVGAARAEVQANARHAVESLTTELRFAQTLTAIGANCGTTGASTISFTDQDGNAVAYQLSGTDLQRNGATVVGGVQTLSIWCFDADDAATGTLGEIRSVRVQVVTGTESGVAVYHDRNQRAMLEARVRLRNVL